MPSDEDLDDLGNDAVAVEEHPAIPGVTIKLRDRELDGDVLTPEYLEEWLEANPELQLVQATLRVQGGDE